MDKLDPFPNSCFGLYVMSNLLVDFTFTYSLLFVEFPSPTKFVPPKKTELSKYVLKSPFTLSVKL